jgi:hypothetical protein
VQTVRGDLAREGLAAVRAAHLVTASALLDLVTHAWLADLVDACAEVRCGALFSLTYDGRIEWSVGGDAAGTTTAARAEDPLDALVREAVNAHQLRDKGLGLALGPAAAHTAEELFRRRGYRTWLSSSPWVLGPSDAALADALVTGWAGAAADERRADAANVRAWANHRREAVAHGDFELLVGHLDLLALPAAEPVPGAP